MRGHRRALLAALGRHVGDAVHLNRHAHAVPVDRGFLFQLVREVDDQAVAHLEPNQRAGQAAGLVEAALDQPGGESDAAIAERLATACGARAERVRATLAPRLSRTN